MHRVFRFAPQAAASQSTSGGGGHDVPLAQPSSTPGRGAGETIVAQMDLGWLQALVSQRAEMPLLTAQQVAALLGVTLQRAYELCRVGAIPAVRLGRQVRVSPKALAEYIERGGSPLPGGWRKEPA